MKRLWSYHRSEFIVAIAALLGVLGQGLLRGVLVGAILSLLLLLRRASNPHVAFLGRIPGTDRFSDLERHPDNEHLDDVLAFRVESGLMFFNTEEVFDSVIARVEAQKKPFKLAIWDLSTSPAVDMAGARMMAALWDELNRRGIGLRVVEARSSVRDILRVEEIEEKVGRIDRFHSLADVIADFERQNGRRTSSAKTR